VFWWKASSRVIHPQGVRVQSATRFHCIWNTLVSYLSNSHKNWRGRTGWGPHGISLELPRGQSLFVLLFCFLTSSSSYFCHSLSNISFSFTMSCSGGFVGSFIFLSYSRPFRSILTAALQNIEYRRKLSGLVACVQKELVANQLVNKLQGTGS